MAASPGGTHTCGAVECRENTLIFVFGSSRKRIARLDGFHGVARELCIFFVLPDCLTGHHTETVTIHPRGAAERHAP